MPVVVSVDCEFCCHCNAYCLALVLSFALLWLFSEQWGFNREWEDVILISSGGYGVCMGVRKPAVKRRLAAGDFSISIFN
jgi:hypothetical protein